MTRRIYLDNAATTQKPEPVIAALSECYRECNAPIHRGLYPLAEAATHGQRDRRRRAQGEQVLQQVEGAQVRGGIDHQL